MLENHHYCSVWLKIMAIFTSFLLCEHLNDEWYMQMLTDHIVGWRTSSIRRNAELPKWKESLCEKYPHIVHEEYSMEINDENFHDSGDDCDLYVLEEKMVTGLRRVSWEKVKYAFMNEGADVIQHIVDHFELLSCPLSPPVCVVLFFPGNTQPRNRSWQIALADGVSAGKIRLRLCSLPLSLSIY